jgi:hypothetical protein
LEKTDKATHKIMNISKNIFTWNISLTLKETWSSKVIKSLKKTDKNTMRIGKTFIRFWFKVISLKNEVSVGSIMCQKIAELLIIVNSLIRRSVCTRGEWYELCQCRIDYEDWYQQNMGRAYSFKIHL